MPKAMHGAGWVAPALRSVGASLSAALLLLAAGCSGGGSAAGSGTAPPPPAAKPTAVQAARFLAQATFGPRQPDIDQLSASGYEAWLSAQFNTAPTLQLPQLRAASPASRNRRLEIWWDTVVNGPDQLRQRMAFALSEIFVVSDQSAALTDHAEAVAYYHDLLAGDAFGNFRNLLEDVTLSPAMGLYLNMLGNQKPDPANNVHADENYAREVMQLFTIGLVQLNPDGTTKTDAQNRPLPTYGQAEVSNLARVLTGWSWNSADFFNGPANNTAPMVPFADYHDLGAKTILNGVAIAAGSDARSELKIALDTLFNHPNVGPFIGRQLIQRLVTSNPSPAYVARVAQVFADNGHGVRGDLQAVIRAVLLDAEARDDAGPSTPGFGKRREPLITVAHLWRAFSAAAANGRYMFWYPEAEIGQAPFGAPSVFNFFSPRFSPAGPIKQAGLVAPEFQRVNAASVTLLNNFFSDNVYGHDFGNPAAQPSDILLKLDALRPLATGADSGPLLDRLNLWLMSGQMSAAMRQTLVAELNSIDASDGGTARILEAIFLIMTSPQYQIQK